MRPRSIPVKYHARGSHALAGLADVPRYDAALANFRDLLAAQGNRSFRMSDGEGRALSGAQLYLFDASLAIYCPRLLEKLHTPRYFPVDYLRQMGPRFSTPCEGRPSHPSLFVGPGRSRSGFHRDSFGTRFWMAVHGDQPSADRPGHDAAPQAGAAHAVRQDAPRHLGDLKRASRSA